jgi:hypothetical protein
MVISLSLIGSGTETRSSFLIIGKVSMTPDFNYGEFAAIKIQSDLEITQMKSLVFTTSIKRSGHLLDR